MTEILIAAVIIIIVASLAVWFFRTAPFLQAPFNQWGEWATIFIAAIALLDLCRRSALADGARLRLRFPGESMHGIVCRSRNSAAHFGDQWSLLLSFHRFEGRLRAAFLISDTADGGDNVDLFGVLGGQRRPHALIGAVPRDDAVAVTHPSLALAIEPPA